MLLVLSQKLGKWKQSISRLDNRKSESKFNFDNTQKSISLTLWGEEACKKCQMVVGDIMGVKAARCSEFGGRSLNASDDHA